MRNLNLFSIWVIFVMNQSDSKKQSSRRVLWIGVLRNFAKFTGKHLCLSLFFNKVAGPAKFLRTTFPTEHLRATASKAWKECRINLRFFQTDIFKCEIFFQLTPEILFVFKLAWHWLADTQRSNSCLCDVLPSYRMSYDIAMTWCVRCVGGIS